MQRSIDRREMLGLISGAALGLAAGGCARDRPPAARAPASGRIEWKMVTTWPPDFPIFGTGARRLARTLQRNSGGRLQLRVFAAGELVPAFEALEAVSSGVAQLGHGSPVYWRSQLPAAQLFTGLPFGMTAPTFNAWIYHGGGLGLWREAYAPLGLVPLPAGNTGVQMGGWFKREIRGPEDLRGLRMRIAGLGGEVLRRLGGTPVILPGAEVLTALTTGSIDATEWTGPYNDLAWGLHQAARYYYYPGWHEPSGTIECFFNAAAFEALPDDLRGIAVSACQAENTLMTAEFAAWNQRSLEELVTEHSVELQRFPDTVLRELQRLSREVLEEFAASDPLAERVYASYDAFQRQAWRWEEISDAAYLSARRLPG